MGTIPEEDRTPSQRPGNTSWFHDFKVLRDRFVLQHSSLDAYLYLRFLRFIVLICFVGVCITWPILLPINATGGGSASQLDRLSFSNIAKNDHLWAHAVVAWVFLGAVIGLIIRERLLLIGARQAFVLDEVHASRLASKTVLFLNAPHEALGPENMERIFGKEAVKVWPVKNVDELEDLCQERNDAAYQLEKAEVELSQKASNKRTQQLKKSNGHGPPDVEAASLVPKQDRPTHRVQTAMKKVDSIDWSRKQVVDLAEQIKTLRDAQKSRTLPDQSAVFVAFASQQAAHRAYEKIKFVSSLPTEHRYLGVQAKEVLWKNLSWTPAVRASKATLALVFVIAFIIFFSIPVGIIGSISNVKYLAENVRWLSFVNDLPPAVLGLLEGLLPPFLVSWFVSYVPKLFRRKYSTSL